MADNARARLQNQIQAQLAQNGEYLVQSQSRLASLESVDEASRHAGQGREFVLVESELESPTPDFLGPSDRASCTIVHKKQSTLESSASREHDMHDHASHCLVLPRMAHTRRSYA
jgi:hypothetical protein